MSLWVLVLVLGIGSALLAGVAFLLLRWVSRREPYCNFLRLRNRRKHTFVRLMIQDGRVPPYVKAVPFLLLLYLSALSISSRMLSQCWVTSMTL